MVEVRKIEVPKEYELRTVDGVNIILKKEEAARLDKIPRAIGWELVKRAVVFFRNYTKIEPPYSIIRVKIRVGRMRRFRRAIALRLRTKDRREFFIFLMDGIIGIRQVKPTVKWIYKGAYVRVIVGEEESMGGGGGILKYILIGGAVVGAGVVGWLLWKKRRSKG